MWTGDDMFDGTYSIGQCAAGCPKLEDGAIKLGIDVLGAIFLARDNAADHRNRRLDGAIKRNVFAYCRDWHQQAGGREKKKYLSHVATYYRSNVG